MGRDADLTQGMQGPARSDVVLGGSSVAAAPHSLVLGGWAAVQRRFEAEDDAQRIAAIRQAKAFGEAGVDLCIHALQDPTIAVQRAAYRCLSQSPDAAAHRALLNYCSYALFECLAVLQGHVAGITAIAIGTQEFLRRPARTILASASRDGVLKLWDADAQLEMFSIPTFQLVYGLLIEPENNCLLALGRYEVVSAWSLHNGQELELPEPRRVRRIASVTNSVDRYLISGSQKLIRVWDLQAGREVANLPGHTNLVTAVAVHANLPYIVSGSEDCTVRIWGIPAG